MRSSKPNLLLRAFRAFPVFFMVFCLGFAMASCVVEQHPDWVESTSDTGGREPGDLWCASAVGALVQHNGQPVPGNLVEMTDGEWPIGCQCVDDSVHLALSIWDELDGDADNVIVLPNQHPLANLRDAIHVRTHINCQRRAYDMAEEMFCEQYCGAPFFYDWDDFSDFTDETCQEVIVPRTQLFHIGTLGDCYLGESNPLP